MYCEFYQLTERPFNVTPDPKFLYLNARYREAIASLNYGISQRKGFITLIGEAGTGKTTLLKRLLEDLDPKTKTVFIFNTNVTFEEILEYIFAEFDLPVHNGKKLYMLQRLNTFLLEELRSGGNVALLIDEAQDLEFSVLEDLRLLSNLETAKEKILQIVLSGQPELGQKLSNPILRQLRQRISINCRLLPLSRDEITEYLQYRLQAAGSPDLKLFTREAEDQIYHFSRGVPRLVNVVCDNALVIGYALGKKRIGGDIIKEAAADLLPVEIHDVEPKHQPGPAVAVTSPKPQTDSRWGTRLAVLGFLLFAVVAGLSIGRTTTESRSAEQLAAMRERLEVIDPGARAAAPEGAPPAAQPARPPVAVDLPADDVAAEPAVDTGAAGPDMLEVRDLREEARRQREQVASVRALPEVRYDEMQMRERFRRIEPPPAAIELMEPPAVALERVEPEAPQPNDAPMRDSQPAAAVEAAVVEANPVAAVPPAADVQPVAPVAAAPPRIEPPKVAVEDRAAAGRTRFDEADDQVAPQRPEPMVTADAALPAPALRREPLPRVEAMDLAAASPDAGALVVEMGEEEQPTSGTRLDGVRFARIRVQEGDSVSGIAIRRYGQASPTILDLMKLANPNLSDVDKIVVGQTIRLPQLDEAFPVLNEGAGRYSLLVYSAVEAWRANGLRDELRARGFSATLTRASLGAAKPLYRVVVTGFSSRDEVVDAGKKLQRIFREDRRVAELSDSSR